MILKSRGNFDRKKKQETKFAKTKLVKILLVNNKTRKEKRARERDRKKRKRKKERENY